MQESCSISETADEVAHFRAKKWAAGPWRRYLSIPIDAIVAGNPGSITIPLAGITKADIVCETRNSAQDELYIDEGGHRLTFDALPGTVSLQPAWGESYDFSGDKKESFIPLWGLSLVKD